MVAVRALLEHVPLFIKSSVTATGGNLPSARKASAAGFFHESHHGHGAATKWESSFRILQLQRVEYPFFAETIVVQLHCGCDEKKPVAKACRRRIIKEDCIPGISRARSFRARFSSCYSRAQVCSISLG